MNAFAQAWARAAPFAEPALAAAAALWLGWVGLGHLSRGSVFALLPLLASGIALAWTVASARRLRLRLIGRADGPGIVQIQEGRIIYFGPEAGGFAALDGLETVSLIRAADGQIETWVLEDAAGSRLDIPAGAIGAERLPDLLGGLPGFSAELVIRAGSSAGEGGLRAIWRRPVPKAARLSRRRS